jgi:hypothetical protein
MGQILHGSAMTTEAVRPHGIYASECASRSSGRCDRCPLDPMFAE